MLFLTYLYIYCEYTVYVVSVNLTFVLVLQYSLCNIKFCNLWLYFREINYKLYSSFCVSIVSIFIFSACSYISACSNPEHDRRKMLVCQRGVYSDA